MRFGEIPVDDAEGSVLAHTVRLQGLTIRKGRVLDARDLSELRNHGVHNVTVARIEEGDQSENEAARSVADALVAPGFRISNAVAGRVNLQTEAAGIVSVDAELVRRINEVSEAITLATVPHYEMVAEGRTAAAVKIVTFGIPSSTVDSCVELIKGSPPALRLERFTEKRFGLIQTLLPGFKTSVADKAVESMTSRLLPMGCRIDREMRCRHATEDVADTLTGMQDCDIILVLGASSVGDRHDVVPSAITRAGGKITRLGIPVDPGHLTLLGKIGRTVVVGLPGSARSPRLHGIDLVLQRLVANVGITDVETMGVGGLLKDQPARLAASPPRKDVAGLLLAAGESRRMGTGNKMLAEFEGAAMVVRAVRNLVESRVDPVIVVLGHDPGPVVEAIGSAPVRFVYNPEFPNGMSTSLRAGLQALPDSATGVVVALGDMPLVTSEDIDALIDVFDSDDEAGVCIPTHKGKRGNPVLWSRRYFPQLEELRGDTGARDLLQALRPREVPRDNSGILVDFDTPESLADQGKTCT